MRRREFITLLACTAAAVPFARAQQRERLRRIGVLSSLAADDPQAPIRVAALLQGLKEQGWTDGRNLRIDYRWGSGDAELFRRYAAELIALTPEVILTSGLPCLVAVRRATRTVPIVFVQITDPVGAGLVASLARPGGNITGFTLYEYSMGAKWLELLREIAPAVKRVLVLRDPAIATGIAMFAAIQAVASSYRVEVSAADVHDLGEIDHALGSFAHSSGGGVIVLPGALAAVHRKQIIALMKQFRLPSVYAYRYFVADGGLIAYGPDPIDQYRRAAGYIDRILKGEKPAALPVQAPTKYELAINVKTAKALGLTVPQALLTRAEEVIE